MPSWERPHIAKRHVLETNKICAVPNFAQINAEFRTRELQKYDASEREPGEATQPKNKDITAIALPAGEYFCDEPLFHLLNQS